MKKEKYAAYVLGIDSDRIRAEMLEQTKFQDMLTRDINTLESQRKQAKSEASLNYIITTVEGYRKEIEESKMMFRVLKKELNERAIKRQLSIDFNPK